MSDRPSSSPPEWATDPGAAIIVPDPSEQELGWVAGTQPPAEYLNWWQHLVYLWITYLAESVFTGPVTSTTSPPSISVDASDGTYTRAAGSFLDEGFAIGQRVSFSGFVNATNNSTEEGREISALTDTVLTVADNAGLVDEAGTGNETATAWIRVDANAHVDGNLHVLGATSTFEGDLGAAGDLSIGGTSALGDDLAVDGDLDVTGTASISGDVTLDSGSGVVVSGAGRYKHGDIPLVISPAAFLPTTGSPSFSTAGEPTWTATGADVLYAAIELPVGKRLRSISFANTRSAGTLTFEVYNHDVQNGTAALVGASLSVSSGTSRAVSAVASITGDADATIGTGEVLMLVASLGASGNKLHGAILTFDEP